MLLSLLCYVAQLLFLIVILGAYHMYAGAFWQKVGEVQMAKTLDINFEAFTWRFGRSQQESARFDNQKNALQ